MATEDHTSIQQWAETLAQGVFNFYQDSPAGTVRELYRPVFDESERQALDACLASGWVAMGGDGVEQFEARIAEYCGVPHAVGTVNATAALHLGLLGVGVQPGSLVITQSNTFVAPINAIRYCQADPIYMDIERESLGMSASALERFFDQETEMRSGVCHHIASKRPIGACLPVHVLGFPVAMPEIMSLCRLHGVPVVEDAAEALGSAINAGQGARACGAWGDVGIISFNANKLITTGAGGMLLTSDGQLAERARHLSRIAKVAHPYETQFDAVGFNYGLPNLNAAIGLAQLDKLPKIWAAKQALAEVYKNLIAPKSGVKAITGRAETMPNHWINAMALDDPGQVPIFIEAARALGLMVRPLWKPLHLLPAHRAMFGESLPNTEWAYQSVVQLPSSPW